MRGLGQRERKVVKFKWGADILNSGTSEEHEIQKTK